MLSSTREISPAVTMANSCRPELDSASLGSGDDHDEELFGSDEDIFEEESDGELT